MLDAKEKSKVSNLFKFLKQYNNIKNPTVADINLQNWNKWLDDIPIHEKIENNIYREDNDTDSILIVRKPEFINCPQPPLELNEWLEIGWNKFDEEVKVKASISKFEKDQITGEEKIVEVNFEDDKDIVSKLEEWKNKRDSWAKKERITHDVDDMFNTLYTVYSTLKKE